MFIQSETLVVVLSDLQGHRAQLLKRTIYKYHDVSFGYLVASENHKPKIEMS